MRTMSMTKLPYTIVFQCVDPPEPLHVISFRSIEGLGARLMWDVMQEFRYVKAVGCSSSGEWSITVYAHPKEERECKPLLTQDPEHGEKPYIYAVEYPKSVVLVRVSYMDAAHWALQMQEREETDATV